MASTPRSGTGALLIQPTVWSMDIALSASPLRILADLVDKKTFTGPGASQVYHKLGEIAAQPGTFATRGSGATAQTAPAYTNFDSALQTSAGGISTGPSTGRVTVTPGQINASVQYDRDFIIRALPSLEPQLKARLGISLYNTVEIDLAQQMVTSAMSSGTDTTTFTWDGFMSVKGKILTAAGDLIDMSNGRINGGYHVSLWNDMLTAGLSSGTPVSVLSAATRGEANGPAKTGLIYTAFGTTFGFTRHIRCTTPWQVVGGGAYTAEATDANNVLFGDGGVLLLIKEMPEVLEQDFDLTKKIIAVMDYGQSVLWPELVAVHNCDVTV